jgi:hypothetical protein
MRKPVHLQGIIKAKKIGLVPFAISKINEESAILLHWLEFPNFYGKAKIRFFA